MPNVCVVKNCKNKSKIYFKFPSDDNKCRKWLDQIKHFKKPFNSRNSRICAFHFEDKYIKLFRKENNTKVPLKRPRLKFNATLTIFDSIKKIRTN